MLKSSPAYLFIGSEKEIYSYLTSALKKIFCKTCDLDNVGNLNNLSTLNYCKICKNIENKKHESIRFIEPEGQYTISQLDIIFSAIIFKLEQDSHFFFIINKAELLNLTCSNSLLKSLEEPPAGYHFILITSKLDSILPTITSRCVIKTFSKNKEQENGLLFKAFINIDSNNLNIETLREIEGTKVPDYLIPDLVDQLYNYFSDKLKKTINQTMLEQDNEETDYLVKVIEILDASKKHYPMPGSSKIFLKNLYLQILNVS